MAKIYDPFLREAIRKAIDAQRYAHVGISGVRVGACVIASTAKEGYMKWDTFAGCNIELASSKGFHAESVALTKAISEGYPIIYACVVTSNSGNHKAAMCGYCMQDFLYANTDADVIVADNDGKIMLQVSLRDRNGTYGYFGKGRLQI